MSHLTNSAPPFPLPAPAIAVSEAAWLDYSLMIDVEGLMVLIAASVDAVPWGSALMAVVVDQ